MQFQIEDHDNARIVRVTGEIAGNDPKFVEAVTNLLAGPGARVVIDLSGVPFMNSTGLADIVRIAAQGNVQECEVVLAGLTPFVKGVLQTTRLVQFFQIAETVEAALQKPSG
jgi:anti-sigma B factor antagonist